MNNISNNNKFNALDGSDSDEETCKKNSTITHSVSIEDNMFNKYYKKDNTKSKSYTKSSNYIKSSVTNSDNRFDSKLNFNKPSFSKPNFNKPSFSKPNFNKSGFSKSGLNDTNDGFMTIEKKNKIVNECIIKSFVNNLIEEELLDTFKILAHHNDDKNWDYLSYHNITTLTRWIEIPKFFNSLNTSTGECKYTDFDIFIMKNDISPMWEDSENRNGSICSIKIDSIDEAYPILKILLTNIINNTLLNFSVNNWNIVNGISFCSKKT